MMVLTPVIAGTTTAGSELKKNYDFFHDVTVVCEYPSNRHQAQKAPEGAFIFTFLNPTTDGWHLSIVKYYQM
ncbi:Uncharacterised protein [Escherichia coli]|nr:Uncharacterised protein [Escherichia coli]